MNLYYHIPTQHYVDLADSTLDELLAYEGWNASDVKPVTNDDPVMGIVYQLWQLDPNGCCMLTDHNFTLDEARESLACVLSNQ